MKAQLRMLGKWGKVTALLMIVMLLLSLASVFAQSSSFDSVDKEFLLEFNDQVWGSQALSTTLFKNTGSGNYLDLSYMEHVLPEDKVLFLYNGTGGSSLSFPESCSEAVYIAGPSFTYGESFVLECRLKLDRLPLSSINLFSHSSNRWFIGGDGRMGIWLSGETYVMSSIPVIKEGEWTSLRVSVDLSKGSVDEFFSMYNDTGLVTHNVLNDTVPSMNPSLLKSKFFVRGTKDPLEVDFVRIVTNLESHNPTDFHAGEVGVAEGAAAHLAVHINEALRPICYSKDQIRGMSSDVLAAKRLSGDLYDQYPSKPSIFFGVFECSLIVESETFNELFFVDVYVKKPEDGIWKKVTELVPENKPETGPWRIYGYWDSRHADFDWTESDAQNPYETSSLKIKYVVR